MAEGSYQMLAVKANEKLLIPQSAISILRETKDYKKWGKE